MAAVRPAGLDEEQTEVMTDLMVMKLATFRAIDADYAIDTTDPSRIMRDEIRMVIVDTEILLRSDDIAATLDRWKDGG